MSTKTILKRVALLSALSLVAGLMATTPAQAKGGSGTKCDASWVLNAPAAIDATSGTAFTNAEQTALGNDCLAQLSDAVVPGNTTPVKSITATQVAGPTNYVRIKALHDIDSANKATSTYYATVTGGAISSVTGVWGDSSTSDWILSGGNTVAQLSADADNKNDWKIGDPTSGDYITVPTPTIGQIVIKWKKDVYVGGVLTTSTTLQTFTINVSASTSVLSYVTVNGHPTDGASATPYDGTAALAYDKSIYAPKGSGAAPAAVATVYVHQIAPGGSNLTSLYTKAVTASLSGVGGLNGTAAGASVNYVAIGANGANNNAITLYNDGRSGVATVTIAVNGVVAKTIKVTFYGSPVAIKTEQNNTYIAAGGPGMDDAVWVWATDAAGVVVPGVSFSALTSDSSIITNSTVDFEDDGENFAFGAKAMNVATAPVSTSGQKATVTYSFVNGDGATVSAPAVSFTLGGSIKTVTTTLDAPSYSLGSPAVLTLKALDASGNTPFDGQSASFVKCVTNSGGTGTNWLCSGFGSILNGSATIKTFAPVVYGDGTWTVDRTMSDYVTHVTASATLSADVTISAAADAAAEATDAANAATDAANAAAEAADAATAAAQDAADAVAALAAQVSTMISALKKQLIALTNLVIKIQKKVKA